MSLNGFIIRCIHNLICKKGIFFYSLDFINHPIEPYTTMETFSSFWKSTVPNYFASLPLPSSFSAVGSMSGNFSFYFVKYFINLPFFKKKLLFSSRLVATGAILCLNGSCWFCWIQRGQ